MYRWTKPKAGILGLVAMSCALTLGTCAGEKENVNWYKIVDEEEGEHPCQVRNAGSDQRCTELTNPNDLPSPHQIILVEYGVPLINIEGVVCDIEYCAIRDADAYHIVKDDRNPPLSIGDWIGVVTSENVDGFAVVRADSPEKVRLYINHSSFSQSEKTLMTALREVMAND